jgi:hypothetical protein
MGNAENNHSTEKDQKAPHENTVSSGVIHVKIPL